MKTSEEFLHGVYGKRDKIVKKRKKQMAVAATAVCTVLCIGAVATNGLLGKNNAIDKSAEIEQSNNRASNVVSEMYGELNADYNDASNPLYPEIVTKCDDYIIAPEDLDEVIDEIAIEGVPEIVTEIAHQDSFGYEGEKAETGESVDDEPATESSEKNGAGEEGVITAVPSTPMYSTEEIVEAALKAIPEDEMGFVILDSAEATVTRYADGKQEYMVGFRTTQDKYIKVKLDSDLNLIKAGS